MRIARRAGWIIMAIVACFGAPGTSMGSFFSGLGSASTPSAGLTTFTYILSFDPNSPNPSSSQLTSGSYVTLYDFSTALVPSSTVTVPSGISSSIQALGFSSPNFPGTIPPDSASINNVTFTYTGSTLLTAATFPVTVTLPGTYTLGSQFGAYGGLAAFQTTSFVSTTGSYFTPVLVTAAVPEPSSLVLGGIAGAVGLATALLRRKRGPFPNPLKWVAFKSPIPNAVP